MAIGDDISGFITELANQRAAAAGVPTIEQRQAAQREIEKEALARQLVSAQIAKTQGEANVAPTTAEVNKAYKEALGEQAKAHAQYYLNPPVKPTAHKFQPALNAAGEIVGLIDVSGETPKFISAQEAGISGGARTKAAPAPPKPQRPLQGTDAQGNAIFINPATGQPAFGTGGPTPLQPNVERVRTAQAGHVVEQANALLQDYANPKAKDLIGGPSGVVNEMRTTNPLATIVGGQADPLYQHIRTAEASLSAFQPIMHGSRGGENMLEHFEKNIRGNPAVGIEQRAAAVHALIEAAKRIQSHGPEVDLSDLQAQMGSAAAPSAPAASSGFRVVGVRK